MTLVEILQLCVSVIAISGLPVLLANMAKSIPFMKFMDGQTNRYVLLLTAALFIGIVIWSEFYGGDASWLLPMIGQKLGEVVALISLAIALFLNKPINEIAQGTPVVGRSFNDPK
jgi:hypothetical protein